MNLSNPSEGGVNDGNWNVEGKRAGPAADDVHIEHSHHLSPPLLTWKTLTTLELSKYDRW